jgi:hypothetical protein
MADNPPRSVNRCREEPCGRQTFPLLQTVFKRLRLISLSCSIVASPDNKYKSYHITFIYVVLILSFSHIFVNPILISQEKQKKGRTRHVHKATHLQATLSRSFNSRRSEVLPSTRAIIIADTISPIAR